MSNFLTVPGPLRELTRKGSNWEWNSRHLKSFDGEIDDEKENSNDYESRPKHTIKLPERFNDIGMS